LAWLRYEGFARDEGAVHLRDVGPRQMAASCGRLWQSAASCAGDWSQGPVLSAFARCRNSADSGEGRRLAGIFAASTGPLLGCRGDVLCVLMMLLPFGSSRQYYCFGSQTDLLPLLYTLELLRWCTRGDCSLLCKAGAPVLLFQVRPGSAVASCWSFWPGWSCHDVSPSRREHRLMIRVKPSQSSNWGAETWAKRKSTSPCLLAIPAFDCKAGLNNRHLNSNTGICLRWRFWSQAEGLDWSCQRLAPRWHWTNCGRDKLCLVGCLGSEPRLPQSQKHLLQALRWSRRAWWGGDAGCSPTLHHIPWHLTSNW